MSGPIPLRLRVCEDRDQTEEPGFLVAFASSDLTTVDQHFGSSTRFVVYRVSSKTAAFLHLTQFEETNQDGNESKLTAKIAALAGCAAVLCVAVGGSAVRQLVASGIQPIKVEPGSTIREALVLLGNEIKAASTPWVLKALKRTRETKDQSRFDDMEQCGWNG
jgi:nitrogen fixation protein NifX